MAPGRRAAWPSGAGEARVPWPRQSHRRPRRRGAIRGTPLQYLPSSPDAVRAACSNEGATTMPTVTTKDGCQIFYKDWGQGQPIVFHHGWPLSSDDWDCQMLFFLERG